MFSLHWHAIIPRKISSLLGLAGFALIMLITWGEIARARNEIVRAAGQKLAFMGNSASAFLARSQRLDAGAGSEIVDLLNAEPLIRRSAVYGERDFAAESNKSPSGDMALVLAARNSGTPQIKTAEAGRFLRGAFPFPLSIARTSSAAAGVGALYLEMDLEAQGKERIAPILACALCLSLALAAAVFTVWHFLERPFAKSHCNGTETAQLGLQERANLLSILSRQVPGVIYQYQLFPDGKSRFPYASEGVRDIYEVAPEEIRESADKVFAVLHPADKERISESIRVSAETLRPWHCQYRVNLPLRGERWLEGQSVPSRQPDGSVLWHGYICDVTDRHLAEIQLRNSEMNFRHLAENIAEVFWLVDIDLSEADNLIYVSPTFEAVWGSSCKSLYENPYAWLESIHPEDRDRIRRAYACKPEHGTYNEVYRIIRPDGEVRWIHDKAFPVKNTEGRVFRIAGVANDITERKRTDELLRESEARLRAILEAEPECVKIVDRQCRIVDMNPAGLAMIEAASLEEVQGLDLSPLLAREYHSLYREGVAAVFRGERVLQTYELIAPSGRTKWMEQHAAPLFEKNDEGVVKYMLAVTRDITERKNAEKQLLRASRMEAIDALAGGIAHDINNSLQPVMITLGFLKLDFPETAAMVDTLEACTARASEIVKRLMKFSKGAEGKRGPVDPAALYGEIEKIVKSSFPKNISLKFHCSNEAKQAIGDSTQLHQILLNLCLNSKDAMPDGGVITFDFKNLSECGSDLKRPAELKGDDYLVIRVKDSGTGIPPHIIDKVFEPFVTTKPQDKGTGLGLFTVYGIVQGHRGAIKVESVVGKGTEFILFLPAGERSAAPVAGARREKPVERLAAPASAPAQEKTCILLVDDEPAILKTIQLVLRYHPFTIFTSSNIYEAVELATLHREQIQVVITDMRMPEASGIEVIRALSEILPHAKYAVMSGYFDDAAARTLREMEVDAILSKPFTQQALLAALAKAQASGASESRASQ